ncbi:transcription antitermination factor NusB [Treponema phagedenis]|uniref:Transcription antitermination protein NusB n=1 Tax=Treponema phagedenis TaxID=162 RepID=A0A0B7GU81_TREPH|nr:transcription antitermination factor NusB [Treponema phagedenis]EFW38308.1 transcription antitermination factor NusB [Treponema phagedenis F0421]NVP24690.1 transcription antitermination factor NusB [Treponema phagedenis]QEJ95706.1 transcription antitermination factor NusB [Treponema phagedenis]QEJ98806.1 transcription antitermination factor NusB [Treponema phagedenis]QEK00528.1 transcription antitermination factor NusB [Treponema phagedenis]
MQIGRRRGRILAFQALFAWDFGQSSPEELVQFEWFETKEPVSEEAFLFPKMLFLGTLEHLEEIDTHIKNNLHNWDFDRLNKADKAIIRLGVYSLLFQKDTPSAIVIDEAVNLARSFGTDDSFKFVNAILDSIAKTA